MIKRLSSRIVHETFDSIEYELRYKLPSDWDLQRVRDWASDCIAYRCYCDHSPCGHWFNTVWTHRITKPHNRKRGEWIIPFTRALDC